MCARLCYNSVTMRRSKISCGQRIAQGRRGESKDYYFANEHRLPNQASRRTNFCLGFRPKTLAADGQPRYRRLNATECHELPLCQRFGSFRCHEAIVLIRACPLYSKIPRSGQPPVCKKILFGQSTPNGAELSRRPTPQTDARVLRQCPDRRQRKEFRAYYIKA
jgi:hypothetical protein